MSDAKGKITFSFHKDKKIKTLLLLMETLPDASRTKLIHSGERLLLEVTLPPPSSKRLNKTVP